MTYQLKPHKIKSIKKYIEDVKMFQLDSKLNPKPGQFFELSILGVGECPLASCSYNPQQIDMLIRNAGGVTNALFNLKKGDSVFIRGPYGKGFPLKELEGKNLIMMAGGTGIAPITSLINYAEQNMQKFKSIKIYFGFRNEDYILLKDKIDKWKKIFNVTITLDEKSKNPEYSYGFVHQLIEKEKPDLNNTLVLMCGPEIMMSSCTSTLNKLGLKNNQIYWSMERRMECGFGNCGRCLIQDVYVCKDGPVFRYDFIKPRLDNENSANGVKE